MKMFVKLMFVSSAAAGLALFLPANEASAQVVVAPTVTPVVTYYRPNPILRPFRYAAGVTYAPSVAVTPVAPVTSYYAPAAPVTSYYAPTTTYYAPTTTNYAPTTTYYAPSAPVRTYYAPSAPVRTYYAPAPVVVRPW